MKLLWQICFCLSGGEGEGIVRIGGKNRPTHFRRTLRISESEGSVTVDPSCEIILNLVAWKISGFSWKFNEKSCFSSLLSKFRVNDENPIRCLRALLFGRKVLPVRLGIRYVETAPMGLSIL